MDEHKMAFELPVSIIELWPQSPSIIVSHTRQDWFIVSIPHGRYKTGVDNFFRKEYLLISNSRLGLYQSSVWYYNKTSNQHVHVQHFQIPDDQRDLLCYLIRVSDIDISVIV